MSENSNFKPYIPGVEALSKNEVEAHLKDLKIVYYGETPEGLDTPQRENRFPIEVEGYPYSVLISGDLITAKKILVKAMSWSDHPGRGFEGLREAMIADPSEKLAVIGISFPGAGLDSPHMTQDQKGSLKGKDASTDEIGRQQWVAITNAMQSEILRKAKADNLAPETVPKLSDYDFIISGSSQGATNAVGLVQSLPNGIKVKSIGLAEETDLETRGRAKFMADYIRYGSAHFKDYTRVNPYNQYPDIGPEHNPFLNALKRPVAHMTGVVNVMANGRGLDNLIKSIEEKELAGVKIKFVAGSNDKISSSLEMLKTTKKFIDLGKIAAVETIIHSGHYHPYLENLANAQAEFRSFAH